MRKILFLLLVLSFQSCKANFVDTTIIAKIKISPQDSLWLDVIVIGGQSQAEGGDQSGAVPTGFGGTFTNALIFYKPTNTNVNNGSWQALHHTVNNNFRNPTQRFGVETGLAKYISDSAGKRIYIIKYGFASSKLVDHGTWTEGHWQVGATHNFIHYNIFTNNFVKPGLDSLISHGYHPHIVGFIWYQGEADSNDSLAAPFYHDKLVQLFDQFKTDMRSRDALIDNMRVIIVRTANTWPYSPTVRQAQFDIATNYPNATMINSDPFPRISDSIHITRLAQATMLGKQTSDYLIPFLH